MRKILSRYVSYTPSGEHSIHRTHKHTPQHTLSNSIPWKLFELIKVYAMETAPPSLRSTIPHSHSYIHIVFNINGNASHCTCVHYA